jgi:putative acetyltransferase
MNTFAAASAMHNFRKISREDNPLLADIVRKVMREFSVDPTATIVGDPALDYMYESYQLPRSVYFVAEVEDQVIGGCGIAPLPGTDQNICELQRMFLLPEARGKNIGRALLDRCLLAARDFGFDKVYLETLSEMKAATTLYKSYGFTSIENPLGNTGHTGCNTWMEKNLKT